MKLGCFAGGLALVLIASAPSPAQDAKPKISDPKLREAVARFEEANTKMSDGDPDPYIACWSRREDALDLGTGGGYGMKGFAEISKQAKIYAPRSRTKGFKNTFEYVSVIETKELSTVVCTQRWIPPAEKQEDMPLAFRSTLVFRLEDGEWKLALRHFDTLVNARRPAEMTLGQRGGEPYDFLAVWYSPATLLTHDEIVRDLKLTADQQESIGKAYAEHQQTVAAFPQRTPQNTEEVSRKRTEANQKLDAAVRQALGDKAQRIVQIAAQSAGLANAFVTRPDPRGPRLALTPAQLAKGREILEAVSKEMTPGDVSAKSRTTFVDKTTLKLLELLTDEQKKLWQEATGEPVPAEVLATVRGGLKRESKE